MSAIRSTKITPLDAHPQYVRKDVVSDSNPKHPLEGVPSTILATVTAGALVLLLGWVGISIHNGAQTMAVMGATAKHVEKSQADLKIQQERMLTQQAQTHEALIIMSATYATKEDLIRQRQILQDRLDVLDTRLRTLEAGGGTRP